MWRGLVRAYLGQPGSGKTYTMAAMAQEWSRERANRGKPIFSTFQLKLPGVDVRAVDPPGDDWGAPIVPLLEAEHGLLLLDEAALIFDSRSFQRVPGELIRKLMQIRKAGLECWWATQHLEYVDKRLRLLTRESYHVGCFGGYVPYPLAGFLITIRNGLNGRITGVRWVRRTPGRDRLYDTYGVISAAAYLDSQRRIAQISQETGGAAPVKRDTT